MAWFFPRKTAVSGFAFPVIFLYMRAARQVSSQARGPVPGTGGGSFMRSWEIFQYG
jgi:hypothetical protein